MYKTNNLGSKYFLNMKNLTKKYSMNYGKHKICKISLGKINKCYCGDQQKTQIKLNI